MAGTGKRGRPAGSKNKNKKTEKSAPQAVGSRPGHNTVEGLDDEHRQSLTRQHADKRRPLLEKEKAARADRMNYDKVIKAELGANGLADIKLLEELDTPEGEAKLKAELERQARVARWAGVGIQLDLLNVGEPSSADRARSEAVRDANSGKAAKTDYSPGTPEYDAYMEAWHEAHSKRNATLAAAVNGDAGEAAAEAFDDSVPDAEPKAYSQQLREENKDIEQKLRDQSEQMQTAEGEKNFPDIPENMKREAETA